jgi:hypothetical protein
MTWCLPNGPSWVGAFAEIEGELRDRKVAHNRANLESETSRLVFLYQRRLRLAPSHAAEIGVCFHVVPGTEASSTVCPRLSFNGLGLLLSIGFLGRECFLLISSQRLHFP